MCVKLRNGHHITLIWQKKFKKGCIDNDVLYDGDDGHKENDHDNPIEYGDNHGFSIIITNDDDDVDGVVYDVNDHDNNGNGVVYEKK